MASEGVEALTLVRQLMDRVRKLEADHIPSPEIRKLERRIAELEAEAERCHDYDLEQSERTP